MGSIEGGHLEPMCRLLDAGARIDGDPESEEVPLGHACWRGRVQMARELVDRRERPGADRRKRRPRDDAHRQLGIDLPT